MKSIVLLILVFVLSACSQYGVKQDAKDPFIYSISCSEFNTKKEACRARVEAMCVHGVARIIHYQEEYQDYTDGFVDYPKHHYTVRCKAN